MRIALNLPSPLLPGIERAVLQLRLLQQDGLFQGLEEACKNVFGESKKPSWANGFTTFPEPSRFPYQGIGYMNREIESI